MSKSLLELTPVEAVACCSPADPGAAGGRAAERIAPLLKALADPVRLRLLSLVASHADGEACVCDLNDAFDLSQPTISHHLKVLHEVGLLDREQARRLGLLPRLNSAALADLGALPRAPSSVTLVARRAAAELVGTAFLVMAVVGSGIAAEPALARTTSASSCWRTAWSRAPPWSH